MAELVGGQERRGNSPDQVQDGPQRDTMSQNYSETALSVPLTTHDRGVVIDQPAGPRPTNPACNSLGQSIAQNPTSCEDKNIGGRYRNDLYYDCAARQHPYPTLARDEHPVERYQGVESSTPCSNGHLPPPHRPNVDRDYMSRADIRMGYSGMPNAAGLPIVNGHGLQCGCGGHPNSGIGQQGYTRNEHNQQSGYCDHPNSGSNQQEYTITGHNQGRRHIAHTNPGDGQQGYTANEHSQQPGQSAFPNSGYGQQASSGSYGDHPPQCERQLPARSPALCHASRQGPNDFYQPQNYAGVNHLETADPNYPVINKHAFLILSGIQAVCALFALISGIVVTASNARSLSINRAGIGTAAFFYSILCGLSVAFGILNYRASSECKVITDIVLSVLCSVGSLGPICIGIINASDCSYDGLPYTFMLFRYCPGHVVGFSGLMVFVSLVVAIVAIVRSAFSCRAMCCLRPRKIRATVPATVPTNNNLVEHSTKL